MTSLQVSYYDPYAEDINSKSDSANNPGRYAVQSSQAVFLALAITLDVPIVSHDDNSSFGSSHVDAGGGASFMVSRSYESTEGDVSRPSKPNLVAPHVTKETVPNRGFIVKKVQTQSNAMGSGKVTDAAQLAAITNELRILGQSSLRSSDNIVKLLYVAWDEMPNSGRHWPSLVLEPADCGDLKAYIQSRPTPLSWDSKQQIMSDLADGVAALHQHGVVHCDLKLENTLVFVGWLGRLRAKLCDFGFSVILRDYEPTFMFERVLGTPPWNAPELTIPIAVRVTNLPYADIYNLALVLSQVILDGKSPFGVLTLKEVEKLKVNDSEDKLLVHNVVRDSISGALAAQPGRRGTFEQVLRSSLVPEPSQRASTSDIRTLVASLATIDAHSTHPTESHPAVSQEYHSRVDSKDTAIIGGSGIELDYEKLPPPILIPQVAQQEVFQALSAEAKGLSSSGLSFANVCYALALSYLQGYGTEPDHESGLEWLRKAADAGHPRAIMVVDNVHEAHGVAPPDGSDNRFVQIQEIARKELIQAKFPPRGAAMGHWAFLATRTWVRKDVSSYVEYVESREFKVARACHWLSAELPSICDPASTGAVDFTASFKQFGWDDQDLWLLDTTKEFADQVKRLGCINQAGKSGLTLLQLAAVFGHLELAKVLLANPDLDIEATGGAGLEALWLACYFGQLDVALLLLEHGASAWTRDFLTGRTILHLLSRFPSSHLLYRILEAAMDAGVAIEEKDWFKNEPMNSPCLSWDFSLGRSRREILLKRPVMFSGMDVKPTFSMAARDMDVQTLKLLLECAQCSPQDDVVSGIVLTATRISGFAAVLQCSKLYRMSIRGKELQEKLAETMTLLLERSRLEVAVQPVTTDKALMDRLFPGIPFDLKHLPLASSRSHDDVLAALLTCQTPSVPVDINETDHQGNTALAWSIERRNLPAFHLLLQANADPTLSNHKSNTPLSIAARAWPAVIPTLIAVLESRFTLARAKETQLIAAGILRDTGVLHTSISKDTVLSRNADFFAPHELALLEGTPAHLQAVRWLTDKYHICWDTQTHSIGMSTPNDMFRAVQVPCTMLATLIRFATSSKSSLVLEAPITFLLEEVQPGPSFVCCKTGTTLLILAMGGWEMAGRTGRFIGDSVLRKLLRRFGSRGCLDVMDDHGLTALHAAAWNLNYKALGILGDMVGTGEVSLSVDVVDMNGSTALDAVHNLLKRVDRDEEYSVSLDPVVTGDSPEQVRLARKDGAYRTAQILRDMGCHYGAELDGVVVLFLACPAKTLSLQGLEVFLGLSRELHGVSHLQETVYIPTKQGTSLEPGWSLRLCWFHNGFVLRACSIPLAAVDIYRQQILDHEASRTFGGTSAPWTTTEYEEVFLGKALEWTRKGLTFSEVRVKSIVEEISKRWKEVTGGVGAVLDMRGSDG